MSLLAMLLAACWVPPDPVYICNVDRVCIALKKTSEARCLFDGDTGRYCAASDGSCASGWRWDESAPRAISDQCVDPTLLKPDGGAPASG